MLNKQQNWEHGNYLVVRVRPVKQAKQAPVRALTIHFL